MTTGIWRAGRRAVVLAAALLAAAGLPVAGAQAATGPKPGPDSAALVSQLRAVMLAGIPRTAVPPGPAGAQVPVSFTYLSGVFCTSASNCWAVGQRQPTAGKAVLNQVLHWNGKAWRKVSVPNPAGTATDDANELFAVRCLNARNCWAVGEDSKGSAPVLNQALHWNGKKWTKVSTPDPGGSKNGDLNELYDVTCTSAASCWTVGEFGNPPSVGQRLANQALHWNGRAWSRVRTPNPGGTSAGDLNALSAVRCASAKDCNAVGDYASPSGSTSRVLNEALHWNGARWYQAHTPNPGGKSNGTFSQLDALGCGSSMSCWAAGSYGTHQPPPKSLNQILHWNGKKWTKFVVPNPGGTGPGHGNMLIGATCTSAPNCWGVGSYDSSTGGIVNEAMRWNGKKWSLAGTPDPAGTAAGHLNILLAVRCTSGHNCWAVGIQESVSERYRDEILHWNGKKWSVE